MTLVLIIREYPTWSRHLDVATYPNEKTLVAKSLGLGLGLNSLPSCAHTVLISSGGR